MNAMATSDPVLRWARALHGAADWTLLAMLVIATGAGDNADLWAVLKPFVLALGGLVMLFGGAAVVLMERLWRQRKVRS